MLRAAPAAVVATAFVPFPTNSPCAVSVVSPVPPCGTVTTPVMLPVPRLTADHVLSPRRNVVRSRRPVTAVMFVVPMLVSDAPDPLNVVPVTVPVILAPPADTVIPPAVTVSPPLSTVGPVMCGDVASTTFPLPV